jgi:hypothetical protein
MLYLTDPVDGEWREEHGGAVRLFARNGEEVRLRPKFNRFAMFQVSSTSLHEIEKITWGCGWTRCRLALSGWFTRQSHGRSFNGAAVYLRSSHFERARREVGRKLEGSLALYNLMREQRIHSGLELEETMNKLGELKREYAAHHSSPDGTSFLRHAPGPESLIIVLNDQNDVVYLGSREGYPQRR